MTSEEISAISSAYIPDPIDDGRNYPIYAIPNNDFVQYWAYCDVAIYKAFSLIVLTLTVEASSGVLGLL